MKRHSTLYLLFNLIKKIESLKTKNDSTLIPTRPWRCGVAIIERKRAKKCEIIKNSEVPWFFCWMGLATKLKIHWQTVSGMHLNRFSLFRRRYHTPKIFYTGFSVLWIPQMQVTFIFFSMYFDAPFMYNLEPVWKINRLVFDYVSFLFGFMWNLMWRELVFDAHFVALIVPTFDTKVTEYLCSGWVFFSSDKFRLFN